MQLKLKIYKLKIVGEISITRNKICKYLII